MASQVDVTYHQIEKNINDSITPNDTVEYEDIFYMTLKIKSLINKHYKHWYVIIDIRKTQAVVDLHIYDCKECLDFELINLEVGDITEYKNKIIIDSQ